MDLFLKNNIKAEKSCIYNSYELNSSFNSLKCHFEDSNKFLYKQIKFEFEESLKSMTDFLKTNDSKDHTDKENIDIEEKKNLSIFDSSSHSIKFAEKLLPKEYYIEPSLLPKVLKIWDFLVKFKKYLDIDCLSLDRIYNILVFNY